MSRGDTQDLMVHYNLPAFAQGDCAAFLAGVARSTGLLKKGGQADLTQAARTVLRDWTTGKLPFYTDAPHEDAPVDVCDGNAKETSLAELYVRSDEVALAGMRIRKEMRKAGGLVKIRRGEMETRRLILDEAFVVEETEGNSESESEGNEVGEAESDGADLEGDEDEEGEEGEESSEDDDQVKDLSALPLTGKRKRQKADLAKSTARPVKKVAFAVGTQDRTGRQARSTPKSATKPLTKPTSTRTSKPPLKKTASTLAKVAAVKAKTGNNATAGTDTDAYDFDQFFRS